jgi:hypothetical protein
MKHLLKYSRIEFLSLPYWRKVEIVKAHVRKKGGLSETELRNQVNQFCDFLLESLKRDYNDTLSTQQINQMIIDSNLIDRKDLVYRNNPKISRRI